jgi:hypothetical protein
VRTVGFRALAAAFGAQPRPFGAANLALYALAIALVAGLALRVVGDRAATLAATALWAFLPVHVEPVAYASALGDQLSLVFQLLALAAAARAIAKPSFAVTATLASLVLAALAMGAKEMAITEGPLLAVGVACAWRSLQPDARRRAVAVVAAHAALTVGFLVLRTHVIGAVGQGAITGLSARIALRAVPIFLWKYVAVVAAPLGHAAAYGAVSLSRARAAVAWLGVAAVAVALWRLKKPMLTFALAWFAVSLVPVLHVVPLLAYYADRFAYVPSIGLALAAGVALAAAGRWRRIGFVAAGALAVVYAVAVPLEARAWQDERTLWSHAVDVAPDAALAQSNFGIALLRAHAYADALAHLQAAERIAGEGPALSMQMALALEGLGRYDEAAAAAARSLALADSPDGRAILARIKAKAAPAPR